VPSDLLSYAGDGIDVSTKDKVDNVKSNVKAVMDVIEENKKKQLKEKEMEADMAIEERLAANNREIELLQMEMSDDYDYESCAVPQRKVVKQKCRTRAPRMDGCAPPSARTMQSSMVLHSHSFAASSAAPVAMESMAFGGAARAPVAKSMHQSASPFGKAVSTNKGSDSSPGAPGGSGGAVEMTHSTQPPTDESHMSEGDFSALDAKSSETVVDFTSIPKKLDTAIEKFGQDCALRSTTIKTSDTWTRQRQENLLTKAVTTTLGSGDIKTEKDKAFDLLDALSRSGSLPISFSETHVIVCVTHCFEKNVMETVIQDNINPVEKLEMSTLLIASTIHGVGAQNLIANGSERARLASSFPALIEAQQTEN
ncbi:MAG: hypothetical protein SGILL_010459, partial [Bacillariaceae sp.]